MEVADGEPITATPEVSTGSKVVVLDTTRGPKRKCSEKQLAALKAAREKAKANREAMLAAGGPEAVVARATAAAAGNAGAGDDAGAASAKGTGDGPGDADESRPAKRSKLHDPDIDSAVYTPTGDSEALRGQAKNPTVSATDNLIVRIKRGEKKPLLWFTGDASQIIKLNGKPLVLYP